MCSIITKKGLMSAADRHDGLSSDSYAYLKNGVWWAGIVTMVAGEGQLLPMHILLDHHSLVVAVPSSPVANFAAYCFAPPILVTPLGAGTVLVGSVVPTRPTSTGCILNQMHGRT